MKITLSKRILSVILSLALIVSCLPLVTHAAEEPINRVVDPSTMDAWKQFFLPNTLTTENAGGVWTDKSVFTDDSVFEGTGITQTDADSFLVALSVIASNMSVTGMSNVPADTMLVLDVSGSMNDNEGNNDVAEELVEAANESIRTLLETNLHHRVGVVLYSGPDTQGGATTASDAVLILPLGRYETGDDGAYLSYTSTTNRRGETTESVGLDEDVVYEGTNRHPTAQTKEVVGGTYIQKGLNLAAAQFTDASNTTTVTDPVLGTLNRKPIVVLMSDGAPTVSTTEFTSPAEIQLGDGTYTSAAIGFLTQLTAAYVKAVVEEKYGSDCLFYTLGLGTSDDTIATSVLNPVDSVTAVDDFWKQYGDADVGGTVTVRSGGRRVPELKVTKISQSLSQEYVDRYFEVNSSASDLAEGLKQAFRDIVDQIQLQSRYFPTLVAENEDLSGYVSFADRIGQYMEVTDIKGILIDNILYSGAELARNFAAGSGGGNLGSYDAPTALGMEMVAAVRARLGLDSDDAARTLIGLAYEYGQLSYTSPTQYSNYIGWYANAAGEFLGFWHEGITTMPEPTGDVDTDPAFIIRSYGYLGAVDESYGVVASDMMYATVQVRESIATGEQLVAFAVPAALIPVVSYQVTLNQEGELAGLEAVGAEHPIRLVYEVALDDAIDSFTLKDLVSQEYLEANTDENGNIRFYTNQYETDNTTGYGKVNTYSYFNPSRQNEKYYYLADAPVYTDAKGTLYTGEAQPAGTFYRAFTVYVKDGNALRTETHYRQLSKEALATAKKAEDGSWYIAAGNVHVNLDGYTVVKDENSTGTLTNANVPFVDAHNHSVGDLGYSFYVGSTLGNNGRITLTPATGIALSKILAPGATLPDSAFRFVITNMTDPADSAAYPARVLHADGSRSVTAVQFENGQATVALNAGETFYIGGMSAGTVYTVEEVETLEYIANVSRVEVTVAGGQLAQVEFINADRGTGNLTITKEVLHTLGSDYVIPAGKTFSIQVQLSGIGTASAQFDVRLNDGSEATVITDENGCFAVELAHDQQITVLGLPAGTEAVVTEPLPGAGFTAAYRENGQPGDGQVTVEDGITASVAVMNRYEPDEVYPVDVVLEGTKIFENDTGSWNGAEFEFQLQKWSDGTWTTIATAMATQDAPVFDFNEALAAQKFTAPGAYYYQVVETNGGSTIDGITYDATLHTFGILVTDADMDGQLEIDRVISYHTGKEFEKNSDGAWQIDVQFHNYYNASGCSVALDVQKELINLSGSPLVSKAGFCFGLYDSNGQQIAVSDLTDGVGEARIVLEYALEDVGTHTYTLKEIVPENPIPGMTYVDTVYTVVVEVVDNGDGTTSARIASINGDEDAPVPVFTNTYVPKAVTLPIDFVGKQLTGRDLQDQEFTFEIRDAQGKTVAAGHNDAQGKVTFDKELQFDAVGTWFYTILETSADGKGVTTDKMEYTVMVTVTDDNGVLQASYSVLNVVGNRIVFENKYTPKAITHTLGGSKILTGRVLLNNEFTFILSQVDENGAALDGGIVLETRNFADGKFVFPEISFDAAGTYRYVISEKQSGSADFGIRYDETRYLVTITVEDNLEGQLLIREVRTEILGGEAVETITFTNVYSPKPVSTRIPGNKTLVGKVLSGGDFSFLLYASDENWSVGELLETVCNGADGSIVFQSITYETPGDRYYLVREMNGGEVIDGVTYDDTVYRVHVEVTDDLVGKLHATVHIYDDGGVPQQAVEFRNSYSVSGTAELTLNGTKTLYGRMLRDGEFTFELYQTDETFAISGEAVQTVVNADGKFQLMLRYSADDVGSTFYYVVRERNAGTTVDGVTYSNAQYYITVTVEDNGVGGVRASADIRSGDATVSTMEFVNTYAAAKTEIALEATKTLLGRDLVAEEFTFDLYRADAAFAWIGEPIRTAVNAADGSIRFAAVEFDAAGIYYFVVTENAEAALENVAYDQARYHITVTVTDNGLGSLEAKITRIAKAAEEKTVDQITFTNIYTPDPDALTLNITARKTVRNTGSDQITPEGFRFLLENVTLGSSVTAESDAKGLAVFTLRFTEEDIGKVYTYKLSEINDGRAHVTYSTAVYNISIAISLSQDNTLVATILNNGAEVSEAVGEFENVYHYSPPDNPKTGDAPLAVWVAMMIISAGSVLTLSSFGRKRKA